MFAVPLAPLVHGAQRGTTTGPGVPGAPMWMCAAVAGPVRLLNESCQFSTVPESDFVSVAVKLPVAEPTSPFGAGTSSEAAIVAPMSTLVDCVRALAPPATTSAITGTSKTSFFTESSLPGIGIAARPLSTRGTQAGGDSDCASWASC